MTVYLQHCVVNLEYILNFQHIFGIVISNK